MRKQARLFVAAQQRFHPRKPSGQHHCFQHPRFRRPLRHAHVDFRHNFLLRDLHRHKPFGHALHLLGAGLVGTEGFQGTESRCVIFFRSACSNAGGTDERAAGTSPREKEDCLYMFSVCIVKNQNFVVHANAINKANAFYCFRKRDISLIHIVKIYFECTIKGVIAFYNAIRF